MNWMRLAAIAALLVTAMAAVSPARALSMADCSTKYQAAQKADKLNGMKWNDFRKAECGPDATMTLSSDSGSGAKSSAGAATITAKPSPSASTSASTVSDAKSLSMTDCSTKYKTAQGDGTLPDGMKWNDFRKAECGPGATMQMTSLGVAGSSDKAEPAAPTTKAPRGVSFPSKVDAKYSSESAGKARLHTCLDAYYVNKKGDALGGLKWIQKGGGYYSLCNAKLKG